MIIELRSLLPACEEEESLRGPGKNSPGEKREGEERLVAEAELRPADLPQVFPAPENVPSPGSSPVSGFFLAAPPGAAGAAGTASVDDRIPELLERLVDTAERSAALSERIADLMERQNSLSAPVYA